MQIRKYGEILSETIFDKNIIVIKDDYAEIILKDKNKREIARTKIDLEDIDKIKYIKWHFIKTRGYARGNNKNGKDFMLHRFLLNPEDNEFVDHINGDKLDNRKCNLRIVTKSQNGMNSKTPSNNTSGVKGVYWDKRSEKWEASIQINMKKRCLGYFKEKEDAIKARREAEKRLFGEYSREYSLSLNT